MATLASHWLKENHISSECAQIAEQSVKDSERLRKILVVELLDTIKIYSKKQNLGYGLFKVFSHLSVTNCTNEI